MIRGIRGARPPTDAGRQRGLRVGGPVVGRRQRQALRLSRLRDVATTADLMDHVYPRVRPEDRRKWHWEAVRRAASRYWERAGQSGRYLLWRPKH
jgi:hypothetical protein